MQESRGWEKDSSTEVPWTGPILLILGAVVVLFGLSVLLDLLELFGKATHVSWFEWRPDDLSNLLGSAAEVVPGVLAIVLTVVIIIVELSATRYTPKVVDLFVKDPVNFLIFALFVVAAIFILLQLYLTRPGFVSPGGATVSLALLVICMAVAVPYFLYVIKFARPENIIYRLKAEMEHGIQKVTPRESRLIDVRNRITKNVEGLSDIALGAIANVDRWLVQATIWSLQGFMGSYLKKKETLPTDFFAIPEDHFLEFPQQQRQRLESNRLWVEMTCFRQYEVIYGQVLGKLSDVATTVALCTRRVLQTALKEKDMATAELGVKFFNTFLRKALNARDARSCYNVLFQYRLLGEAVLIDHPELAVEVAEYLRFYGQYAEQIGLSFILETVAHDLKDMNKTAYETDSPVRDRVLQIFLEVDWKPESEQQESTLRGVRKAQALLASYYLLNDEEALARRIAKDMGDEPHDRLRVIRDELLAVETDDFWEITDRGVNFEYTDDAGKEKLNEFFDWFLNGDEEPSEVTHAKETT